MKLKKILINILVPLNSQNEINEKLIEEEIQNDILGFHVVLSNKITKKFSCEFFVHSENTVFWSIDKKQTINKLLHVELNIQRCKFNIEKNQDIDLFIWSEKPFLLKSVTNIAPEIIITELNDIILTDTNDKEFIELFGFKKKYHFDQYRKLLILGLYEQKTDENQKFIVEMVEKILIHAKSERAFESTCDSEEMYSRFYNRVFRNLLEENCGILDAFSEYREKVINKLKKINTPVNDETKIILGRNDPVKLIKKIDLNNKKEEEKKVFTKSLFDKHEINKTFSHHSCYDEIFTIQEISRKRMFFEPQNSIILYKYDNIRLIDIEQTIDRIVQSCIGETYEIIFYFNQTIDIFEKIVIHHDNLFRIKIVSPKMKLARTANYTEMQKLIILTNFSSCINNYIFLITIGSMFPKKYMNDISIEMRKEERNDEIIILGKGNTLNKTNGKIDYYETNTNKLFNYFVECMFPVIPKSLCKKLNFKSPHFGHMEKFKDLKNFLMKNGTINNINIYNKLPEEITRETLHICE